VDVRARSMRAIARELGEAARTRIEVDPDIEGSYSISAVGKPLLGCLSTLALAAGARVEVDGNGFRLALPKAAGSCYGTVRRGDPEVESLAEVSCEIARRAGVGVVWRGPLDGRFQEAWPDPEPQTPARWLDFLRGLLRPSDRVVRPTAEGSLWVIDHAEGE
jgi:hypothetical protein